MFGTIREQRRWNSRLGIPSENRYWHIFVEIQTGLYKKTVWKNVLLSTVQNADQQSEVSNSHQFCCSLTINAQSRSVRHLTSLTNWVLGPLKMLYGWRCEGNCSQRVGKIYWKPFSWGEFGNLWTAGTSLLKKKETMSPDFV